MYQKNNMKNIEIIEKYINKIEKHLQKLKNIQIQK